MNRIMILAAVYMIGAVGIMFLQSVLSKRTNKIPGLILPIVFFLISFLFPLNVALPETGNTIDVVVQLLFSWVTGNIPTFIMLGIYFISRKDLKNDK